MCVREKVCGEQTDFAFCPPVLQNDEEALLSAATLTDKKTNFRASRCVQAPRPRSLRESLMFFFYVPEAGCWLSSTFFDKRCSMFQFCSQINKKLLQKRSLLSKNHKLPPTKAE